MAQNSNPGNFANDREKAAAAGQKGGQSSGHNTAQDTKHAAPGSGQHKSGNFADNREKASEAGRKGGSH